MEKAAMLFGDASLTAQAKQRGAADVCTISPAVPYAELPLEVSRCGELGKRNGTVVLDGIIECAKRDAKVEAALDSVLPQLR